MQIQEEFIAVAAPLHAVEQALSAEQAMRRWMSPAVQFVPLNGDWSFAEGARWQLGLTGFGSLLRAEYLVVERRPGLVLWAFDGFWEGFDAWHWFALADGRTAIQNRLEYTLRIPGLSLLWPATVGPLMGWDAKVQMQRLARVCHELATTQEQIIP